MPDKARKIVVKKSKALVNKKTTLKEAVEKYIKDSISIGIGGFVDTKIPISIIHEIIHKGARGFKIFFRCIKEGIKSEKLIELVFPWKGVLKESLYWIQ